MKLKERMWKEASLQVVNVINISVVTVKSSG